MTKRSTEAETREGIEIHEAEWQGIKLEIRFERNWLNSSSPEFQTAHLAIVAVHPVNEPLPITETGYRSHFLAAGVIDKAGGPVAYVRAWLDREAQSESWKASAGSRRQLSLF